MKKTKNILANFIWFSKFLFGIAPVATVVILISPLFTGLIATAISWYYSKIIDVLIEIYSSQGKLVDIFDLNHSFMQLFLPYTLLMIFNSGLYLIQDFYSRKIQDVKLNKFMYKIYSKLGSLEYQHYYDKETSNLLRKLLDNYHRIYSYYRNVGGILDAFFDSLIVIFVLFNYSPILLFITLILDVPQSLNQIFYTSEKWEFYNSNVETSRKMGWMRSYLNSKRTIAEHNINKANEYISKKLEEEQDLYSGKEFDIEKKHHVRRIFFVILDNIKKTVSVIYFIWKLYLKEITVGRMTFLWGRANNLSKSMQQVIRSVAGLIKVQFIMGILQDFLALKSNIKSGDRKLNGDKISIRFEDVWFKYPNSKKWILKGVSLDIKSGEEVAIVGENGAGKSTLIKLILRFYEPSKGKIYVNNIPVEEMDLDSYYEKVSALFQEFNTYGSFTAKENVTLSQYRKRRSVEFLEKSLKRADAFDFVNDLDNKYDQILSSSYTGGTQLSWGQWQKIALSRIFYRDASLIILDEPTASIDAKSEHKIFKRIYDHIEDKTVIIISHRFSTVRNAQRIFVLKDGDIVEEGSHEELIELDGFYAESYNMQAQGYK